MLNIVGYNLCGDINSLDPYANNVSNITSTTLTNGIYDHINISKNVTSTYSSIIPTWDFNTILDCDFNYNINGGNVDLLLDQIDAIRIKKRKKGAFTWIALKDVPITTLDDLSFIKTDTFLPTGEDFEYALVPMLNGVEGNYIISEITTEFNGIFISDVNSIFKLFYGVSYGGTTSIQSVGELQPLGSRYPITISNSAVNYKRGSISGTLLNDDYDTTRILDRKAMVEKSELFDAFIKNGKPKIIKDWNGNIWLVKIVGDISTSYNNNYGMGVMDTSFSWVEQGQYDNQEDLYRNGLTTIS